MLLIFFLYFHLAIAFASKNIHATMGKSRTTGSSSATAGAAKAKDSTASRKTGAAANFDWA
jgi:hypothetical protein